MADTEALLVAKKSYLEDAIGYVNAQVEVFQSMLEEYRVAKAMLATRTAKQSQLDKATEGSIRSLTQHSQVLIDLSRRIKHAQSELYTFNQKGIIKKYPFLNYIVHYFRKNSAGEFTYPEDIRNVLTPLLLQEEEIFKAQKNLENLVLYASRLYLTTFIIGEVIIGIILLSIWTASFIFAPDVSLIILGVMLVLGGLVVGLLHLGKSERETDDWSHDIIDEAMTEAEFNERLVRLSVFSPYKSGSYGNLLDANEIVDETMTPISTEVPF